MLMEKQALRIMRQALSFVSFLALRCLSVFLLYTLDSRAEN